MDKIVYKLVYNRKKVLNPRGTALVQVEAYQARKKKYFTTQVYLRPGQWDARRERVKHHPNADRLNRLLSDPAIRSLKDVIGDLWEFHGE